MATNPFDENDPERQRRIRERAYHLWEAEGRPHGRDLEYWERARELEGLEENADAARLPNPVTTPDRPVEEAEIQENLGEFPDRFTDQGERRPAPAARKRSRRSR